jgi:hypothetical protein
MTWFTLLVGLCQRWPRAIETAVQIWPTHGGASLMNRNLGASCSRSERGTKPAVRFQHASPFLNLGSSMSAL